MFLKDTQAKADNVLIYIFKRYSKKKQETENVNHDRLSKNLSVTKHL